MGRADRRVMLKQAMAEVSRTGIDLRASSGDQSWAVIAETRILIDILNSHAPTRASKAAEKAHEFFELSLKRNTSGIAVECAKGCAFCCYVPVSALAPEIFLVANTIRARPASERDMSTARNAHLQALMAALTAVDLSSESYELNEGVAVALDTPNAESRWLKGEDVLTGVA